jgi:hypothetical protein
MRTTRVFVIMPFADAFEPIYRRLIAPAFDGYEVLRADSRLDQQNILRNIVEGIAGADLVVADVTATNANVMYELGAAHALGKPTIMITQDIGSLPFDIRSYQAHGYSTHFAEADELVARLRELASKFADGLLKFGNPFSDFAPSAVPAERATVGTRSFEHHVRYGYLDHNADMERYGQQLLEQFERLQTLGAQLTAELRRRAVPFKQAQESGPATLAQQLTNELAGEIRRYAHEVSTDVIPRFHEGWERVGFAMSWLASKKPENASLDQIEGFCRQNEGLRDALSALAGTIKETREQVGAARGLTGELDEAVEEIEQAFNAIVSEIMLANGLAAAAHDRMGCPPTTGPASG